MLRPAEDQQTNAGGQNAIYACFDIGTLIGIYENNPLEKALRLYPNPAENTLMVKYNSHESCRIDIVNALGQNIFSSSYDGNSNKESILISVENFATGIYYLQLISKEKTYNAKFTIQR